MLRSRRRQPGAAPISQNTQQSSSNSTMARVLLLAASAVALRPTLPKRSRIAPRASLTMHDYDYDVARCVEINCKMLPTSDRWRGTH